MHDINDVAQEYLDLQSRRAHPNGSFDRQGRWWPEEYHACCMDIRTPSKAWPYSAMLHCRTLVHVAEMRGVSVLDLRRAVNAKRKTLAAGELQAA